VRVQSVTSTGAVAAYPRAFVRASGPDAESFLESMVSNDVGALSPGDACEALLLTAKARVIAPLHVLRRAADDYLLVTEPELGERVVAELRRSRFAAKVELELEEHTSHLVVGRDGVVGIPVRDFGVAASLVLDDRPDGEEIDADELEASRILARRARWGREIDDRVLPAEAGLVERAVSFTKGCYPGQEPIARLHHRGHANRGLRALQFDGDELPAYDAELLLGDRVVGRVTSAARHEGRVVALAFVRVEVPADAPLAVGDREATQLD
jgi:folate-binding protein YgfZ